MPDKEPGHYVLLTDDNTYFVEYLLGHLELSPSIDQAMVFEDNETAFNFQKYLRKECNLITSVNTFID
ncbi:hypothetical protein [uncultured Maribacter sp.]|uniref:hypothetical protein n=1 Tax=uncultured Maribacter sp. TaxID=431308 RepID=UPI00260BD4F2|nr:hypothetical protein [uncultured Maribacter sp.]